MKVFCDNLSVVSIQNHVGLDLHLPKLKLKKDTKKGYLLLFGTGFSLVKSRPHKNKILEREQLIIPGK